MNVKVWAKGDFRRPALDQIPPHWPAQYSAGSKTGRCWWRIIYICICIIHTYNHLIHTKRGLKGSWGSELNSDFYNNHCHTFQFTPYQNIIIYPLCQPLASTHSQIQRRGGHMMPSLCPCQLWSSAHHSTVEIPIKIPGCIRLLMYSPWVSWFTFSSAALLTNSYKNQSVHQITVQLNILWTPTAETADPAFWIWTDHYMVEWRLWIKHDSSTSHSESIYCSLASILCSIITITTDF